MIINLYFIYLLLQDLCKYMKDDGGGGGGGGGGKSQDFLHSLLTHDLERTEVRDEIFCQLMRQTTENPHEENALRGWGVLALCCGVFSPSHTLRPVSHISQIVLVHRSMRDQ